MRVVALLLLLSAVAHADPQSAIVIVVDRAMTPEKLDVANREIRKALAKMPDSVRVAIVSAGQKPHVTAPYAAPKQLRRWAITGDLDADVSAALGRACQILSIKANRLRVTRAFVISDRDTLLGVSSLAKKMSDAGYEVSTYGLGRSPANKTAIDAIAISGSGMAYHERDGAGLAEAIVDEATRTGPPPSEHGYIVLLDHGAAMSLRRFSLAQEAVRTALGSMRGRDHVAVIEFAEVAGIIVEPRIGPNVFGVTWAVDRLTYAKDSSRSNLKAALSLADVVVDQLHSMHKHVIIVASGAEPHDGVAEAVQRLQRRSVDVRAVAIDKPAREFLERVAPTVDRDEVANLFDRAPVDE